MSDLYEPCPHHDRERGPTGACLFCGGVGFVKTGVTTGQVDRWGVWERWLNGDPDLPQPDRDRAKAYILSHLWRRGLVGPPDAKAFPIQVERGARPHPLRVPWSVAELAYSVYAGLYGTGQSLERLAERGGFGPSEMDTFLPDWRERCEEIVRLKSELAGRPG